MQCPNCNHWNEAGANFCEECGFELKDLDRQSKPVSVKSAPVTAAPPPPDMPAPPPVDATVEADAAAPYVGAKLVLIATGSIFRLGDTATVGREDPRLDIDLEGYPEGKFVSGNHARIVRMNGRYYLEDLGSSNHTFVNNRRVAEGQLEPLSNEDVIRFGKIELKFYES